MTSRYLAATSLNCDINCIERCVGKKTAQFDKLTASLLQTLDLCRLARIACELANADLRFLSSRKAARAESKISEAKDTHRNPLLPQRS